MPEHLLRELAAILNLSDQLHAEIAGERGRRHFPAETSVFLDYADNVLDQIKSFAQGIPGTLGGLTALEKNRVCRDLIVVKRFLGYLHEYVKRALDADSLRTPVPFGTLLNKIAQAIKPDSKIIVTATEEYNYLQHPIDVLGRIRSQGIFQDYPEDLGLVSFPFSQRWEALQNSILFHELGHFFSQQGNLQRDVQEKLDKWSQVLAGFPQFQKSGDAANQKLVETNLRQAKAETSGRLYSWTMELYCDLFAVSVSGPSYLLAYWCLLASLPVDDSEWKTFGFAHPADELRLRYMIELLGELELFDIVEDLVPEVHTWLMVDRALSKPPDRSLWQMDGAGFDPHIAAHLIEFFLDEVAPVAWTAARQIPERALFQKADFRTHHELVFNCIANIVSPADADRRLSVGMLVNAGELRPTSLLLSSFVFYLAGFPGWSDLLWEDASPQEMYRLLNGLILKGLDDLITVRRFNFK